MFHKLTLRLLLCGVALINATSYDGYKIYDINAKNTLEKQNLERLSENDELDFLALPRLMGVPARVMVPPPNQIDFETTLTKFGLKYSIVNENVGKFIELERVHNTFKRSSSSYISFTKFHRFADINAYLSQLAKSYPRRAFVKTVGKSYEGRYLRTITISNGDGVANKKVIFIDAGIHGREWIAPAVALYIIHQLVENFAANVHLLKNCVWVVLPVVNPDGYEYTHTTSRMWRKTRKPVPGKLCVGTDANRNFNFHWGKVGASNLSCSDIYMGPSAFSEPETRVVRDLMLSLSHRVKMYLTLHSYGDRLLYPWSHTKTLPANWKDVDEVAQAGATAIRTATGTNYTVGSTFSMLYPATGASKDYALGVAKIPVCLTMELPAGGSGFDPPPAQIKPSVEETWVRIKAMAEMVITKY